MLVSKNLLLLNIQLDSLLKLNRALTLSFVASLLLGIKIWLFIQNLIVINSKIIIIIDTCNNLVSNTFAIFCFTETNSLTMIIVFDK